MGTSRVQHTTNVSDPVLHYTNAHQRNDLQNIGSSTGHDHSAPQNVSLWDFPRPRTTGGRASKKPPNLRIKIPTGVVSTPQNTGEGNTIGIALGSPRLIDRKNAAPPHWAQQDPFARPEKPKPAAPKPTAPVQRKPSKWRKIGGLFKAKNAVTPSTSRPQYQVRNNRSPQGWSHSIDYQYPKAAGLSPGVEDRGNCFGGIRSCLEAKRKLLKTDSKSRRRKAKKQQGPPESKDENAPILEVEIPDFHLERYSVMFGGLFGQNRPSAMARRSRTLDEMVSKNKTSTTEPQKEQRPRRATSPTRSRTPSFTLFPPTQVSKASKVLGTPNIPRFQNALSKTHTLPTKHDEEAEYLLNANSSTTYTPLTPRSQVSDLSMAQGYRHKAEYLSPDSPASTTLLSPLDKLASPSKRVSMVSPKTTPHNPFTEKPESEGESHGQSQDESKANEKDEPSPSPNIVLSESAEPSPPVEISIARSVSVSKGKKKQVLIPGALKNDRLTPNPTPNPANTDEIDDGKTESQKEKERILGTTGKTPQVTDVHHGHRPGNSQDVRIETASMC